MTSQGSPLRKRHITCVNTASRPVTMNLVLHKRVKSKLWGELSVIFTLLDYSVSGEQWTSVKIHIGS